MENIQYITLDLMNNKSFDYVYTKQYDVGRAVVFSITKDGEPVNLSGLSAIFSMTKPDGSVILYSSTDNEITINPNSTITLILTDQITVLSGKLPYQISLMDGTRVVSTITGIIYCEKAAVQMDDMRSVSDGSLIEDLAVVAQAIKDGEIHSGDIVNVSATLQSGVEIGEISVNDVPTKLYAPEGGSGGLEWWNETETNFYRTGSHSETEYDEDFFFNTVETWNNSSPSHSYYGDYDFIRANNKNALIGNYANGSSSFFVLASKEEGGADWLWRDSNRVDPADYVEPTSGDGRYVWKGTVIYEGETWYASIGQYNFEAGDITTTPFIAFALTGEEDTPQDYVRSLLGTAIEVEQIADITGLSNQNTVFYYGNGTYTNHDNVAWITKDGVFHGTGFEANWEVMVSRQGGYNTGVKGGIISLKKDNDNYPYSLMEITYDDIQLDHNHGTWLQPVGSTVSLYSLRYALSELSNRSYKVTQTESPASTAVIGSDEYPLLFGYSVVSDTDLTEGTRKSKELYYNTKNRALCINKTDDYVVIQPGSINLETDYSTNRISISGSGYNQHPTVELYYNNKRSRLLHNDILLSGNNNTWDGTNTSLKSALAAISGGGGASDLDDLDDVIISSPSNNQILTYNNTSSKWINTNPTASIFSRTLTQSQYDALSSAQKQNGMLYFVENEDASSYAFVESNDGTCVVRINSATGERLWFFRGFDMGNSGDVAPPLELSIYVPSTLIMTSNYPDYPESTIQNGWVGFYNNNIRGWIQDTSLVTGGIKWGVIDIDDTTQRQIRPYSDPYDVVTEQYKIYYMGKEYTQKSVNNLTDVSLSSLTDGQILKYNSTSQKWENANESGGSGGGTATALDTGYIAADGDENIGVILKNGSDIIIDSSYWNPNGDTPFTGLRDFAYWVDAAIRDLQSGGGGGGGTSLDDLSDVSLNYPSDGEFLKYNSSSDTWENAELYIPDFDGTNSGLVPEPGSGDSDKFLKADGTWATLASSGAIVDPDFEDAITNGYFTFGYGWMQASGGAGASAISYGYDDIQILYLGYWLDDGENTYDSVKDSFARIQTEIDDINTELTNMSSGITTSLISLERGDITNTGYYWDGTHVSLLNAMQSLTQRIAALEAIVNP